MFAFVYKTAKSLMAEIPGQLDGDKASISFYSVRPKRTN
ncbi:hypothetical protein DET61_1064 [Marinobacter nauticus]|uniref:Uncharacterized protein n=1 Tax=Marinobacter nauticus TaxID=2743 RepID=A0A368XLU2_MARNT|nr:hypothetical protein DET61_1064 [Marinobacter nauticus]